MAAATLAPGRDLSAEAVGARVGVSRRTILAWSNEGLPYDEVRVRGGRSRRFNLSEVVGFARQRGRDVRDPGETPAPQRPSDPAAEPSRGVASSLERRIRDARSRFDALLRFDPERTSLDPAAAQRLGSAFRSVSGELRALEAAHAAELERAGVVIKREAAERMLVSAVSLFVSDLEALAADLPRAVIAALADAGTPVPDPDTGTRAIAEAVRRAVHRTRARLAESIEAATAGTGDAEG